MKRHQEFADGLVKTHGYEKALKIVDDCLTIANRESSSVFFDEADWNINEHGKYEFSKTQSAKTAKVKDKRVKGLRNFYNLVRFLLVKGNKNA